MVFIILFCRIFSVRRSFVLTAQCGREKLHEICFDTPNFSSHGESLHIYIFTYRVSIFIHGVERKKIPTNLIKKRFFSSLILFLRIYTVHIHTSHRCRVHKNRFKMIKGFSSLSTSLLYIYERFLIYSENLFGMIHKITFRSTP